MTLPEPGWYPDPTDASRLRLWDGQAWTDSTQTLPVAGQPPVHPSGEPPAAGKSGRTRLLPIITAIVLLAVVAAIAGYAATRSPEQAAGNGAAVVVVPEPATAPGPNAFMESVVNEGIPAVTGGAITWIGSEPSAIQRISGSAPGLYGGTANLSACDANALARTLADDPQLAAAFAGVVGVDPVALPVWIGTLTPVVSREDLRVTNHSYVDGMATAFQSVLQAGTAVLITPTGLPVVRCACGNPLAPPESVGAVYQGQAWPGFDPDRLTSVSPAESPLTTIEVADLATGTLSTQTVAAGGLVLAADGLGLVRFGDDTETVIATMTELLGSPDEVSSDSVAGGAFTLVRWRSLTLVFQVPRPTGGDIAARLGFDSYYFGPSGPVEVWQPAPWESQLRTTSGVGIGTSARVANAAYPLTTLSRRPLPEEDIIIETICSIRQPHQGLDPLVGNPLTDQRIWATAGPNDESLAGVFFVPLVDNTVVRIAGARQPSAACYFS